MAVRISKILFQSQEAFTELKEQKAAWMARKALKEKLPAINEEDMWRALAANTLKLRGDDKLILDMIG